MANKHQMVVVASAGEFEQVKVYLPQDRLEEHPLVGWTCAWCDWLCVAPTAHALPPHECLSHLEDVRAVRG